MNDESVLKVYMNIITTTADLQTFCNNAKSHEFVTVDTEFLREKTYWPILCLIQMATPDEAVIVDIMSDGIDLAPFFELMKDEAIIKVFHAARQDVEIVWHLGNCIPTPLFDTQVAAMVCGFGDSISYDQLCQRIAKAQIDKSSRFTDWSKRPLSKKQLDYALTDVTHLRDIYLHLSKQLEREGRTEWLLEEMNILTSPSTYEIEPADAWKRVKGRFKKSKDLALMQSLASWRENEAKTRNIPRGRILKDDAIGAIAQNHPKTVEALARIRAVPQGFERSKFASQVFECVKQVEQISEDNLPPLPVHRPVNEGAHATVELLKVLLKQVSEQHNVAAKMIATVSELEAIAQDDDADVMALNGWRKKLFGDLAIKLKRGELALKLEKKRVKVVPI
jgi:ribonuclease D